MGGCLQEIVIGDEFQAAVHRFAVDNCHHFEDTEENKLIYTELFQQHKELVEGLLERQLRAAIPGFEMPAFLEQLSRRENEIDAAVFDLLVSLGDFDSFKQEMLAQKAVDADFGIAGTAAQIHEDEESEGEERPDLGDLLMVTSPK